MTTADVRCGGAGGAGAVGIEMRGEKSIKDVAKQNRLSGISGLAKSLEARRIRVAL